ncbi:MAG: sulfotransferase domain-containing protein, partial [Epsilonproteobacteria bacterium]|nr:sulfotransferase domain-containing protein [Campylobacterota bacterium]
MLKKLFKKEEKVLETPHFESLKDYDVVIHIGAPKTGSSALQKFFLENRKSLEKEGIYYPEHGLDQNGISGGHSNFGLAISKEQLDEAKKIFENYINEANSRECKLLLSAESLFIYHEKLKLVTKEYKCKIVVFFRDPIESIFSNYNQGVKRNFQTLDINTFCSNLLDQKNNMFSGNIFEKWCDVFDKK